MSSMIGGEGGIYHGGNVGNAEYNYNKLSYTKGGGMGAFWQSPASANAMTELGGRYVDGEKVGGGFGGDPTGESSFSQMMSKQKMSPSKDITDVVGKAAEVIGSMI